MKVGVSNVGWPLINSGEGFYVYGVARANEAPAPQVQGIHQGPVSFIESSGLRAVVSRVPLSELVGEALAEQVRDSGWLEEKVGRHHAVVKAVMNMQAILPFKFGVVFSSQVRVVEMLASKQTGFLSCLRMLEGKEEYGVEICCDPRIVKQHILDNDQSLALQRRRLEESPGKAYLLRRRLEVSLSDKVKTEARNWVNQALERLQGYVSSANSDVASSASVRGSLLEGRSYLVEQGKKGDFFAQLRDLQGDLEEKGLSIEVTGPWPPYSFASLADEGAV